MGSEDDLLSAADKDVKANLVVEGQGPISDTELIRRSTYTAIAEQKRPTAERINARILDELFKRPGWLWGPAFLVLVIFINRLHGKSYFYNAGGYFAVLLMTAAGFWALASVCVSVAFFIDRVVKKKGKKA